MTIGLLGGALLLLWGLVHLRLSATESETDAWRGQLRRAYLLFAGAGVVVAGTLLTVAVVH